MAHRENDRPVTSALGLRDRSAAGLLGLLLLADLTLIALHVSLKTVGEPSGYTFDLGIDRGYGEFFQYVHTLWAGALALLLAVRARTAVLGAWALVCGYFLADDWLQLHEHYGVVIGSRLPELGAMSTHVGEMVWMAAVGVVAVVVVGVAHARASSEWRAVSAMLMVLFGVLVLFGVVIDAVHSALLGIATLDLVLTTIEDGGELVVMSLVVTFLFAVAVTGHRPQLGRRLARLAGVRQNVPSRDTTHPVAAR